MRRDDRWIDATITALRDLTPGIREITLAPNGGAHTYPTGAHPRVRVDLGERTDIRHYSLVGRSRDDGHWRIAVKREPHSRGGSAFMWQRQIGDRLTITPPSSHFELATNVPEYLLIAGGIGITPIIGMAEALVRRGQNFRFLYAARTASEMAYRDEIAALCGDRARFFFDSDGSFIDLPAAFAGLAPGGEAYVCGPLGLLEAARDAWRGAGRDQASLRFETFGSSGRYEAAEFRVRIPRLDREITVAADASMLDALEAAGVEVMADCRRGECGLCMVKVLDSSAPLDHRDVFLSEAQHGADEQICACVSRAVGGVLTVDTAYRGA